MAENSKAAVDADSPVTCRTPEVPVAPPDSLSSICWFDSAMLVDGSCPVAIVVWCEHVEHASVDTVTVVVSTSVGEVWLLHVNV